MKIDDKSSFEQGVPPSVNKYRAPLNAISVIYVVSSFLTLSKKTKKGEVRDKQEAIQSAIYAKAFSNGTPFGENVVTEREMRE